MPLPPPPTATPYATSPQEFKRGSSEQGQKELTAVKMYCLLIHVFLCTSVGSAFFVGINSFKTFMAYKDVMMLNDEEVKINNCMLYNYV